MFMQFGRNNQVDNIIADSPFPGISIQIFTCPVPVTDGPIRAVALYSRRYIFKQRPETRLTLFQCLFRLLSFRDLFFKLFIKNKK